MSTSDKPSKNRRLQLFLRVMLAGPITFISSLLVMGGAALWWPEGKANIDHIVLPLVLFPAIWAALFFYACFARRLSIAYLCVLIIAFGNLIALLRHWHIF